MLVKVAIDLALDRLFTYEVPEALQKKLAVGQLLSVPFGHREARGFVIEKLSNHRIVESSNFKLKPVTAIVDETPFFSPKLLELVKKVADYSAAPIESVLKAALPAAVLKRNAHAKELLFVEAVQISDEDCRNSNFKSQISDKDCRNSNFKSQISDEDRRDSNFKSQISDEDCRNSNFKSQISDEDCRNLNFKSQILDCTSRQKWLVENIKRLGGGWMQPICRELKTTSASLRTLAAKGLIKISVRQKRRDPLAGRRILPTKPLPLNEEQRKALEAIGSLDTRDTASHVLLLFGVTGSGKTEVYLQAIAKELETGRGAIVMVPEIALTPQTVQRFASRFGDKVAVLHSALSDGERYDEWHRIRSGAARVVVGPRSAVWAPVKDLGLIVVDEEHETSYKQDDNPRYNARDAAVLRGKIEGAKVVLGSATPSLESWMNVERKKYTLVEMRNRAGLGTMPSVGLVEMRGGEIYSAELLEAIRWRLDRGEQTILFLNRRGYSRTMECSDCGKVMECPECGVPYTYHQADTCLRCHICGRWTMVPRECPNCHGKNFDFKGIGTQRAEIALKKCFPKARILRMDMDTTTRKSSHEEILSAFRRGEADILLGTQMIAKGLDFPNVTLVGILNADSAINMPDFRAGERAFQLFAQVAGRAGRAELPGEVLVQSHDISSPILRAVVKHDCQAFVQEELKSRGDAFLPPFSHLASLIIASRELKASVNWADMCAKSFKAYAKKAMRSRRMEVSDAMPCTIERMDGWYRQQVIVRADKAMDIAAAWRWLESVRPSPKSIRVAIDIDAFNLL